MWFQSVKVEKITERGRQKQQDRLAIESSLSVYLNDQLFCQSYIIPQDESAYAIGVLLSQGLIRNYADIHSIQAQPGRVDLTVGPLSSVFNADKIASASVQIQAADIFQLMAHFQEKALLFKSCAVTHSCALANRQHILCFSEDLESNAAFYKVLGQACKQDLSMQELMLLTSDKVSVKMMKQLVQLSIGTVISRTAPTQNALDVAKENGIKVFGFARGRRVNKYN